MNADHRPLGRSGQLRRIARAFVFDAAAGNPLGAVVSDASAAIVGGG